MNAVSYLFFWASTIAIAVPALACSPGPLPRGMTVDQYAQHLFERNEAIVIGKVIEVRQPPPPRSGFEYLYITINTIEPIKGHANSRTVFTPTGNGACGMVGNMALHEGETRLLVLHKEGSIWWPDNSYRGFNPDDIVRQLRIIRDRNMGPNQSLQ